MKPFGILKFPLILAGLGAALAFSPACRAQEVSPDHFTDTGVQDVYEPAKDKPAAPKLQQKPAAPQTRAHQTASPGTLQPVSKRTPVAAAQPGTRAVADKRKSAPASPKKQ